ncbi:MAG: DDE-type integrase/transposase/recombinase [Ramlibacter sp.]|nr:DDE-type integrase/transposase/recombinase [Ramlibacter sp.]
MTAYATAAELAALPGFPSSERRAREAAARMGLPSRPRAGRGGGLEYAVDALPPQARLEWAARYAAANDDKAVQASVPSADESRVTSTRSAALVTGWQKDRQDEIARVLVLFQRFWTSFGGPLTPALHGFCHAWKLGRIQAEAASLERFPSISFSTLRAWHLGVKERGLAAITPAEHHRKGQFTALSGEIGAAVLSKLIARPHLSAQAIYDDLSERFEHLPSDRAFRRALRYWKQQNAQLLEGMTNPDGWRNKYMSAAGNMREGITAPNQLWQMDSTVGDVMLEDGKRHAIIGVIDVYTDRRMFIVARTSRSGAIMSLIRRAILAWGVPQAIKTDNGKDYTAQQLENALLGLGIEHPLCAPFSPHQKPFIERAIGDLMHRHFELLEGYIGHSVAERKGIEARRSFSERLFDKSTHVELRLQPEQLQAGIDAYCDKLHNSPREALGDRTPNQMAAGFQASAVSERALDVLLAPSAAGGVRTVTKKGIKIDKAWFNHKLLGGMEGQEVQAKVDEANLGRCWVFDMAGQYICEALDFSRLGISSAEVAATRKAHQRQVMSLQKRDLMALTRQFDKNKAVEVIQRQRTDNAIAAAANVVTMPRQPLEHTNPVISSIEAADAPAVSDQQIQAVQAALQQRLSAPAEVVQLRDEPQHRYARWLKLQERVQRGEALPAADANWFDGYAQRDEWASMRSYFESFGLTADDVLTG